MDINNFKQTITFNGISSHPEYKGRVFPISTTLLEAFICIVPIILAVDDVDIVHTGLNHLLYGAASGVHIPDSEFSDFIVLLLNEGLVILDSNKHISLTKKGQVFIDYFYIVNRRLIKESITRIKKALYALDT